MAKYKIISGSTHRLNVAMVKYWWWPFWIRIDRFEYENARDLFAVIARHKRK